MANRAAFLWLFIAAMALALGVGVYVVDRSATQVYLLPAALTLPRSPEPLFGVLSGFLPGFLHVFAFTLLTAAVLTVRSMRAAATVAAAWCVTDLLFEIGQHPAIAPVIAATLPAWFAGIPLLENAGPYFLRGTFDAADIAATVAGAVLAYFTILSTRSQGGVP
jgi:hypothetical protein